jgi:HlyD family secretion protein
VLVLGDERLESRDVRTGLQNWQFAEVHEGLEAGELVVVSLDRAEVQEGAKAVVAAETLK